MTDILLIQPPVRDFYHTTKRTVPYGLACIAASLIREGFSTRILDTLAVSKTRNAELPSCMTYLKDLYSGPDASPFGLFSRFRHFGLSYDRIRNEIRSFNPFLVGISSLFTPYCDEASKVAEIVKEVHPGCTVVVGGHHASAFPESALECKSVDFVIQGEGEIAMALLAEAIRKGSGADHVPGIAYRMPDGTVFKNSPAIVENINDLPLPALQLIRHDFYQRKKRGSAVLAASRGCPLKCSYCAVGHSGFPYRRRSVASVMSELSLAISTYHAGFIDFEDENLSFDSCWFSDLLDDIRRRFRDDQIEFRAMNGLLPSTLNEGTILKMKAVGFRTLNLSAGSLSASQLKRFNRPDIRESLDEVLDICRRHRMETVCYIIAGAPGQKPETTVSDMITLFLKQALVGVSIFYPAPGTPDYELCRKRRLLPDHFSLMRSSAFPISDVTTQKDAATIMRLGRIINFMKYLTDAGEPLPTPEPYRNRTQLTVTDRKEIGKILLAWFLHDGVIRGVAHEGAVFDHAVSKDLTAFFLEELRRGMSLYPVHSVRNSVTSATCIGHRDQV